MNYNIIGEPFPAVVCTLNADESMITERGSMCWMSPNMKMETTSNGGIGKAFGRMFSGEALFQNRYTATGGNGMIAFASSFPGQIVARQIAPGQELIVQKAGCFPASLCSKIATRPSAARAPSHSRQASPARCAALTSHPTTRSSFKRAASLQAKARLSSPSIFKSVSAQGCSAVKAS